MMSSALAREMEGPAPGQAQLPWIEVLADIPPLAWLADVGAAPRIIAGRGVDIREIDGRLEVTEGCWEGAFPSSSVARARHLFGSGIVLHRDGMLFCTASHTLEALYVYQNGERRAVSNSLAFLVKYSGLSIDPSVGIYRNAHSIAAGLHSYRRLLYQKGDDRILRFAHCNFRFDGGKIETLDKSSPPRFADFDSYRDYMVAVLQGVRDNAASPERKRSYALMTSVSSGYDSAAAAALGAAAGCKLAVTLRSGKDKMIDTGKPIAEALGLTCVERERKLGSTEAAPYLEADFIVSFDPGDSVFAVFSDVLPGSLLLTGHHGDGLWDPVAPASDGVERKGFSGMGLHEFRLRTDFVTVPVVFIGALRHRDIRAISGSEEMQPFSIGGDYDRPMARRIVEEAGVARALFGQKKKAVNVNLFHAERMMSDRSRSDMEAFIGARVGARLLAQERAFRFVQYLLDLTAGRIDGRFARQFGRIRFTRRRSRRWNRHFQRRWGTAYREYFNHVLIWALARTGERYASSAGSAPAALPANRARSA